MEPVAHSSVLDQEDLTSFVQESSLNTDTLVPAAGISRQQTNDNIDDFFVRNGFHRHAKFACDSFARTKFPGFDIAPADIQGYCSYTLYISAGSLLQFRPESYRLDIGVCEQARLVYKDLVPRTEYLGSIIGHALENPPPAESESALRLHVYLQAKVPGITLSELQQSLDCTVQPIYRRRLIYGLAEMFATGFRQRRSGNTEADDPGFKKGFVGSSLRWRLALLGQIRGESLQRAVAEVAEAINAIENSPWCMTHGDLVPANIMVDPGSGCLTGLIDWAEGEWLPFGVGLYGLEEALGFTDASGKFQYYDDHMKLRQLFWDTFLAKISDDADNLDYMRSTVGLCRKLGILLWRGIAFEDGRIDRVVEAGRDDSEMQKLKLFLEVPDPFETGTGQQEPSSRPRYATGVRGALRRAVRSLRRVGVM